MKTTIEMPDDLYRAAKAEAALRGRKLKDMIEEGLRLVLASSRHHPPPSLAINSGIPDLASNPEHLASFGRNARRDR
jgi:plasmid stability protein